MDAMMDASDAGWFVLTLSLTQSGITWEESLNEGLSRSGEHVSMSVEDCLN